MKDFKKNIRSEGRHRIRNIMLKRNREKEREREYDRIVRIESEDKKLIYNNCL